MEVKKLSVWLPLLFAMVMIIGMWIGYQLREMLDQRGVTF